MDDAGGTVAAADPMISRDDTTQSPQVWLAGTGCMQNPIDRRRAGEIMEIRPG